MADLMTDPQLYVDSRVIWPSIYREKILKDRADARWNGQIIGQGGPTNDQFVSLWTQLADKYKSQSKIIFGIMNEVRRGPSTFAPDLPFFRSVESIQRD